MKKIVALIVCIILIASWAVCTAEDFIIHSGTTFGDSIDDVKKKETFELDSGGSSYKLSYKGNIAGYDGVVIDYYFDLNNDGKLYDAHYEMANTYHMSYKKKDVLEIFNHLDELLTIKYGKKISEKDSAYVYLKGFYFKAQIEQLNSFRYKESRRIEVNSWVVPYDGYYVKIDLYCCYDAPEVVFGVDQANAECGIEYYIYTDEHLNQILNEYIGDL